MVTCLVRDGEHLLVADDPQRFAEAVVELLRDVELRRRLTTSARRLVEGKYDWEIIYHQLEDIFFSVLPGKMAAHK